MLRAKRLAVGSRLHGGGRKRRVALMLAACALLVAAGAPAQRTAWTILDNISYNVGDQVRLRIEFPAEEKALPSPLEISATIRYAGESQPVATHVATLPSDFAPGAKRSTESLTIWKIPFDATTGRYEVDFVLRDRRTKQAVLSLPRAAAFAIHRKLVQIKHVELEKTFFAPGDPVRCAVTLANLSASPLSGLRVEFADRHWPWIAPPSDRDAPRVVLLAEDVALERGEVRQIRSENFLVAKQAEKPSVHQFAVVVWDGERKIVHDIAFSPLVFVHPHGGDSPKPYPSHYVYPELGAVKTTDYRHFYLSGHDPGAIQFDRSQTMFVPGSEATVRFTVQNPTEKPWRGVTIGAALRSLGSAGFATKTVAEKVDLDSGGALLKYETKLTLPADGGGMFRAVVQIVGAAGQILASGDLELASNPLPRSILIFCAHQDDDVLHSGIIRAAAENRIPLNVVYFTGGDAGSCDRYYQHSCSPAEALNFGALRMEEARASLGHLGVPHENIHFLGLPDGGLEQIWLNHPEPEKPYLSVLLASDHAPYEGLARPNLPYARKSVIEAAKEFIRKFQPEVIYTGHPDERHVDHRANNWLVVKALQELRREGAVSRDLILLVDQVYGPGPQKRAPYRYEKHVLNVSGEARARAQEALWFYQSQGGNRALGNLRTFDQLPRAEIHWRVLDWYEHEGWNEKD